MKKVDVIAKIKARNFGEKDEKFTALAVFDFYGKTSTHKRSAALAKVEVSICYVMRIDWKRK